MEALFMVLAGLTLGIVFTLAILSLSLVVLILTKQSTYWQAQHYQSNSIKLKPAFASQELNNLQALMERRQPAPIETGCCEHSEYLALQADIQSDFHIYQRVPSLFRRLMPQGWQKVWKYSESLTYVNDSLPKILADWDWQEFSRRSTSTLKQSSPKDSLQRNFADMLNRCGKMTTYQGIKYFAAADLQQDSGWKFVAQADFEHGWAIITGRVVWQGQRCLLDGFSVSNTMLKGRQ
ncbi:MAG: hypothetical protein HC934_01855 [Acaryochloridaceae cyanobacterium SU_2_1]|nr:hypothetical protein [Acaryochloridaceae cyanobacterium SU_2_1]